MLTDWKFDLLEEFEKKRKECSRLLALIERRGVPLDDYEKFLSNYENVINEEPPFVDSLREDQVQRVITLDWVADGLEQFKKS